MNEETAHKLLKDRRVIEEINRHLWIESEKAGFDIGFEKAAQDWLENYSKAWMNYHLPKQKKSVFKWQGLSKKNSSHSSS